MRLRPFLAAMVVPTVITIVVATAIAATPASAPASPTPPSDPAKLAVEREVAGLVGRMLRDVQYEGEVLDDERSAVWLDAYLRRLDPARMIFRQADVDGFRQFAKGLDDQMKETPNPKLDIAATMFNTFRERYREHTAGSVEIAQGPIDVTNAERLTVRRWEDDAPWPRTDAEARDLWRLRVENDYIEGMLDAGATDADVRAKLEKRYRRYQERQAQLDSTDMLDMYLASLSTTYDPHTIWFPPKENENFTIDLTNSVVGIGAQLSTDEDGYVVVNEVIRGGPAQKSGLVQRKDKITHVAQDDDPPVDVVGERLDDVVSLIRGKKGTTVRLTVQHEDGAKEVIALVREQVTLQDSLASAALETHQGHRVGVLTLPQFYLAPNRDPNGHTASRDLDAEITKLKAQGVEGIVLDLRNNGGGSLSEAVDVAGLFLPGGPVVQVRSRDGGVEALRDDDRGMSWSGPLVVMTDATSASASEIVAGALQDYGRALIVGDSKTHGKGTVQQVIELNPMMHGRSDQDRGGGFKVSIQKFYRVSGGSTQLKGVEADVVLPSAYVGWEVFESDIDNAMPWDDIPPAPFARSRDWSAQLPGLKARSADRVAANAKFKERVDDGEELLKRKEDPTVSLVLTERRAEADEHKAKLADEPEWDKLSDDEHKKLARERDFALDEGISVLVDVLGLPVASNGK